MKRTALLTGALCVISSGAFAQSVTIPAFQNRFGSIHQPVVAVHTVNRSAAFERQTFGSGSAFTTDPAARGVVTSPTATANRGQRLDPTVMNVPVFPGNTAILMQQGQLGFGPFGVTTFPPNVGFGNTGVFLQQGAGSGLVEVDPFRTTATPGPAVNAAPGPAVNAVPNPAAPVPTTPQLVPPNTTAPVQPQNPTTLVPARQVVPGAVGPTGAGQNQSQPGGQQPNR
jgi:hypothetical protein